MPNPTSRESRESREVELLHDLADRVTALGLEAEVNLDRRELLARQPAVTGGPGLPPVGLSQSVRLARHRADPTAHAWLLRLDDGFRGQNGAAYEPMTDLDPDDVEAVAARIGRILALTDSPVASSDREVAPA